MGLSGMAWPRRRQSPGPLVSVPMEYPHLAIVADEMHVPAIFSVACIGGIVEIGAEIFWDAFERSGVFEELRGPILLAVELSCESVASLIKIAVLVYVLFVDRQQLAV